MKTVSALGLPGKVTDTGLILPPGLTYGQIQDGLRLLKRIGESFGWWAADLLVYAETRLSEGEFSQVAEELGWKAQTLMNAMTVARAFPRSRRRESLSMGHHAELTRYEAPEQDHFLDLAEQGDRLPNGEKRRWSVSRLRQELRALGSKRPDEAARVQCTHCGGTGWEP